MSRFQALIEPVELGSGKKNVERLVLLKQEYKRFGDWLVN